MVEITFEPHAVGCQPARIVTPRGNSGKSSFGALSLLLYFGTLVKIKDMVSHSYS